MSNSSEPLSLDLTETTRQLERLRRELAKVIVGQQVVIEQMLTAMIAMGHCLLIGVPGLAKTVMAKALADALDMRFSRVQFTPDLMPSDITGTNILDQDPQTGRRSFRFFPGPVFTNILLADEINRTPPKTQAALLEAMQEQRVTFSGEPHELPQPFFVIATQNPLEQEGTYPLPEAQLDRFMFAVKVSYPTHAEENQIVASTTRPAGAVLDRVLRAEQVRAMQALVYGTSAPAPVVRYAVALTRSTRPADTSAPSFIQANVDTGAGPRAGQYLVLAAKSRAVLMGRLAPEIEDVQAVAAAVLRHRIFTNFTALSENITSDDLVSQLLDTIVPSADASAIVYGPPEVEPAVNGPMAAEPSDVGDVELIRSMATGTGRILSQLQQVIIGQKRVLDLVLISLLAGGHCLLVGVPGLAKTLLVRTLADVLDLDFKRVQFTPDLMPSDITGTDIIEIDEATGRRDFRFIPGPVFTNLLLADEINRTPPKTQAALLESMQELAVTAGGQTRTLEPPFFVLATQNPLEQEGTYPLPEAQLDRFMFDIHLDYPDVEEESIIVDRTTARGTRQASKVIGAGQILRLQKVVRQVPVSRHVVTYVTTLVRATRPETKGCPQLVTQYVHCGAGPRASQYLVLGAKARAVMNGRLNVSINDVKAVAVPVLRHRLFTNFVADAEGMTPMKIISSLLRSIPEPRITEQTALETKAGVEAELDDVHADDDGRIVLSCPQCQTMLKVTREATGQNARCPSCREVFPVPSG